MPDRHEHNPDARPANQQIKVRRELSATPPVPRSYRTAFEPSFLSAYHAGVMRYTYRGLSCLKSPIDLATYMLLIFELKPRTIVEIGSFHGGAALFYADLCRNYGLDTEIVTVDYRKLESNVASEVNDRVQFIEADAASLAQSPLHGWLSKRAHPWLIIEDSAHTRDVTFAVMQYFAGVMLRGDFLLIEDGVIEDQGAAWRYGGGPNLAVHDFFRDNPDIFILDTSYNDFFGVNASFNPNGYLRRA